MKKRSVYGVIGMLLIAFFCPVSVSALSAEGDTYGIVIDGKFTDWQDKLKTDLYSRNDDYNIKKGSLLRDESTLYFYLNMNPTEHQGGYVNIQSGGYRLFLDGHEYIIDLNNKALNVSQIPVGTSKPVDLWVYDSHNWSSKVIRGGGAVYRYSKPGNISNTVLEMRIPLQEIVPDAKIIKKIEIAHEAIWDGRLIHTGADTGSFLITSAGALMAVGGFIKFKKTGMKEK